MLFGKYHIVIFKERTGTSRNVRMRGWLGVFVCLLLVGLAAGNIWLFKEYTELTGAQEQLRTAERKREEQASQLLALTGNIVHLENDLERVRGFNSKLRLMMNMERELTDVGASGGARSEEGLSSMPLHRQELMVRKMNAYLKQLATDTRLEEVRQQELLVTLRRNREVLAALPTIWPVEGFITSRFGARPSPFTGRREHHKGLDISAKMGTPILAPAKGTVTLAAVDGAYGNSVMLNHGAGLTTRYGHMQRFVVKSGQVVTRGDIIGYVGNTGRSSGPHLHYEVMLNGAQVNPLRYILN